MELKQPDFVKAVTNAVNFNNDANAWRQELRFICGSVAYDPMFYNMGLAKRTDQEIMGALMGARG